MRTEDLLNEFNELQTELLTEMDMSAGLYLKFQNLTKNGK